ncbi:MAG: DMT family transporter [Beijerinckiaceae bacterium]
MNPEPHTPTAADYGLYALVVIAWSTSWIAMHYQVGVVAPEISVFWRFLIAAIAMFVIAVWRGEPLHYARSDHGRFAAMGMLMFSSNFILFYHGAQAIPSGLLSVVFSLASIINLLLAAIVFKQPITGRIALGALLGTAGIGLLFAPQILGADMQSASARGLLLCVAGTLCFCAGNLFSGESQRRGIGVISASAWGMAYGTVWSGILSWLMGRPFIVEWTVPYIFALIYLALMASVVAFYSYLTLLGRIGAGRAGYATVMFPVFALLISTFAENYQWTVMAMAGAVLALAGNVLVMRR